MLFSPRRKRPPPLDSNFDLNASEVKLNRTSRHFHVGTLFNNNESAFNANGFLMIGTIKWLQGRNERGFRSKDDPYCPLTVNGSSTPTIYSIGARAHAHALAQLSWETSDAILKLYTYFSRISGANHISPPDVRLRSHENRLLSIFSLYLTNESPLIRSVFITFSLFLPPPPGRPRVFPHVHEPGQLSC